MVTWRRSSVWDGELHNKVIAVEGTSMVQAVDVCPDSTRFATGTRDKQVRIWSVPSGERLIGPLEHDNDAIDGIRTSPPHTAPRSPFSIVPLPLVPPSSSLPTQLRFRLHPLLWHGEVMVRKSLVHVATTESESTDTQQTKPQILHVGNDSDTRSIVLAPNGKLIAALADEPSQVSFLSTSTLARIGPVIEYNEEILSISISPDSSRLATGWYGGKIVIRDLGKIIPDVHGPLDVSICAFVLPAC